METFVDIDTVAKHLDVSKQTIYVMVNQQDMPVYKLGVRAWRFRLTEIDAWMKERQDHEKTYSR